MIPQKLKFLFLLSVPVFIVHGLEEYYTGFYNIEPIFKFFFHHFDVMSVPQATFLVFQIMLWLMLIVAGILLVNDTWRLRLMILPGLVYFKVAWH